MLYVTNLIQFTTNISGSQPLDRGHKNRGMWLGKCPFLPGGGAPENWGDQVLCLRSKGGIKRFFQIKKVGSLIFFKRNKIFCQTFMEFLLILQKRWSFDSVSCWNSSKRG